jgi:hypothetical protein
MTTALLPANGFLPVRSSIGDDADRKEIGELSHVLAQKLLGRHVVRRAEHVADLRELRGLDARDAESR